MMAREMDAEIRALVGDDRRMAHLARVAYFAGVQSGLDMARNVQKDQAGTTDRRPARRARQRQMEMAS